MNSKDMIKLTKKLRTWKIPYSFIDFYYGIRFRYSLCCVIQFSFEQSFLSRITYSRMDKNGSYVHNKWFGKLKQQYVPCSFHCWYFLNKNNREEKGKI